MANNNNNFDRKETYNKVNLIGRIADLKKNPGTTEVNGVSAETFSIRGSIQVGDDASFKVPFSWWTRSHKANGEINERYAEIVEWAESLESIAVDGEGSRVWLVGSYANNDYVGKNGNLTRGYVTRVTWQRNDLTPAKPDMCEIDFDGFITDIEQEQNEGVPTGRLLVRACGLTYDETALPIEFIVPQHLVMDFNGVYMPEMSGRFFLTMGLEEAKKEEPKRGIGEVRVTEGFSRRVLYLTGAELPYAQTDAKCIPRDKIMEGRKKYSSKLSDLKEAGYRGSQSGGNSVTQRSTGIGRKVQVSTPEPAMAPDIAMASMDDFDINF